MVELEVRADPAGVMGAVIEVIGARTHNLRSVSVRIPHDQITAVTGVSGSGKSSLAFGTIYAEAQRRHLSSLSPFARQVIGEVERPEVDQITGLRTPVALAQGIQGLNRRSTIGTVTEAFDYLRALWATAGADLVPADFTFNAPAGACPECQGIGQAAEFQIERVIGRPDRTLREGVLLPWADHEPALQAAQALLADRGTPADTPWQQLGDAARDLLLHADGVTVGANGRAVSFVGVVPWLRSRLRDSTSKTERERLEGYRTLAACPACCGGRLGPPASEITVHGTTLGQLCLARADEALDLVTGWRGAEPHRAMLLQEIEQRLRHLVDLGLGYLPLHRSLPDLSRGEARRVQLAAQLGMGLSGLLYVLDEPSAGLHPADLAPVGASLAALRDAGNTVVIVEHSPHLVRVADHGLELGPGAGSAGGTMTHVGSVEGLSLLEPAPVADPVAPGTGALRLLGVASGNLTIDELQIPLQTLVAVLGVSGAGKTTLLRDVLAPCLAAELGDFLPVPAVVDMTAGGRPLQHVVVVDQTPIGRTSRSVVATAMGVFDGIRKEFAAKADGADGLGASHFSFNGAAGRCPECGGDGVVTVPMHLLPDAEADCVRCRGKRYRPEVLAARWNGLSIADVLDLSVHDAATLFADRARICEPLRSLERIGLGYLKLGQQANTLSGGESQRVRLARELAGASSSGHTVYVLDEPSSGLHTEDVAVLADVLCGLVQAGHSVVVADHHAVLVERCGWAIELGPGAGPDGGRVVAVGTPTSIAANPMTSTGQYLFTEKEYTS